MASWGLILHHSFTYISLACKVTGNLESNQSLKLTSKAAGVSKGVCVVMLWLCKNGLGKYPADEPLKYDLAPDCRESETKRKPTSLGWAITGGLRQKRMNLRLGQHHLLQLYPETPMYTSFWVVLRSIMRPGKKTPKK